MNPRISIVCAVRNGGDALGETVDGLLAQDESDIEAILVNDGSTDITARLLDDYAARDERVRVLHREPRGITGALIEGCRAARGAFIARHDAGDVSPPCRLGKQVEVLDADPGVAMVSSWVRYTGPAGEPAGGARHPPADADEALVVHEGATRVRGPYHGSVMFRREDYEAVGGYRWQFYFVQDVDLWLRLHERGRHHILAEDLYTTRLDPDSISGRCRAEQDRCLALAVEAARARRNGRSEALYLEEAARVRPPAEMNETPAAARRRRAGSLYFMGCMLAGESPAAAARYFRLSLGVYPFQPKAWLRLAGSGWRAARKAARTQ